MDDIMDGRIYRVGPGRELKTRKQRQVWKEGVRPGVENPGTRTKTKLEAAMEGLQKAFRSIGQDTKLVIPSPSTSPAGAGRGSSSSSSADKSSILITRAPRRCATLCMYSKVATVSFIAGVVVGFALNRRIRRWAARLLKKIRDD